MQAASLIKLFIMGTVYENYKSLSRAYGKETIDAQLQPMITVSSNEAANTLVKFLGNGNETKGMKRVTRYCKAHGYKYTSMGRMLLADNSNGDNYTSAGDCGRFLTSVYRSAKGLDQADESMPYAQEMFELLKAQTRRHKIPAMLPASVKVANKTGELYNVENDAAILYDTENGEDLVLVFMAEDLSSGGEARSYISRAALEIYNSTRG